MKVDRRSDELFNECWRQVEELLKTPRAYETPATAVRVAGKRVPRFAFAVLLKLNLSSTIFGTSNEKYKFFLAFTDMNLWS